MAAAINITPDEAIEVATSLAGALEQSLAVATVAGHELQASLPDEARSAACLGDKACLVRAARAAGVDQLVMLVIVNVGEELKVEPTWIDAATGQTAQRNAIDVAIAGDDMDAVFGGAAGALLPDASPRAAPAQPEEEPAPIDLTPPPAEPTAPRGRHMTTASWTLLGAGGALLVGGFGAASIYYLGRPGEDEADYQDWSDSQESLNLVADVAGGLGLAAIAASGILYWRSGPGERAPAMSVDVGDDGFALSFGGQF